MVFNVIDSPGIVSSSKQPKYVTLEYYFTSVPLYIILRFLALFMYSPAFSQNVKFCLKQPEMKHYAWLGYLQLNNESNRL